MIASRLQGSRTNAPGASRHLKGPRNGTDIKRLYILHLSTLFACRMELQNLPPMFSLLSIIVYSVVVMTLLLRIWVLAMLPLLALAKGFTNALSLARMVSLNTSNGHLQMDYSWTRMSLRSVGQGKGMLMQAIDVGNVVFVVKKYELAATVQACWRPLQERRRYAHMGWKGSKRR